jgi:hypothetical protein
LRSVGLDNRLSTPCIPWAVARNYKEFFVRLPLLNPDGSLDPRGVARAPDTWQGSKEKIKDDADWTTHPSLTFEVRQPMVSYYPSFRCLNFDFAILNLFETSAP